MISVRNHPLLLSGSKYLIILLTAGLFAACSPKVRNLPVAIKKVDSVKREVAVKPLPAPVHTAVISLLLPFNLDDLNLAPGADKAGLKKANLAVEYYEGFKLALDSLTALSYNFKLQVFDTKDENREVYSLAFNNKVRSSDLIVGPVYPEGIRYFLASLSGNKKMVVSPLSPAPPEEISNPNLVTVMPPLEYHAWHVADYIQRNINTKTVFVLKSGFSDENKYTIPFKKSLDSLSNKKIKVVMLTVVRGNLSPLLSQFSKTGQNVFVVPSTKPEFLMAIMHSLDTLSRHYPVTLFGHPNWEGASFLKPEVLQRLNTSITSAYRVNYKSAATIKFVKNFRKIYHAEPTDFAIEGFDEGMVFGRLVAVNTKDLKHLDERDFVTLHNTLHFVNKGNVGWINTHVNILKYVNFELKQIE